MVNSSHLMRCSGDFAKLVNYVRATYILAGKRPPSVARISSVLSKSVDREALVKDVMLKF